MQYTPCRTLSAVLTFAFLLLAAFDARAQNVGGTQGFDVYAGLQRPSRPLRDNALLLVRRTPGFVGGLAGYWHVDRSLLWRASVDIAFTGLRITQQRSNGFEPAGTTSESGRNEYGLSLDAAWRAASSSDRTGVREIRLYSGGALRYLSGPAGEACIPENITCTSSFNYKDRLSPALRVGALLSIYHPTFGLRLDGGYHLSRPWGVLQHDIVLVLSSRFSYDRK
jgi:hypothetical protein